MALDTITREEFDRRLEDGNEYLRQELVAAQERVRQLEILIRRKEAFAQKLDQILSEVEQDEAEIARFERELHLKRGISGRGSRVPTSPV